MSSAVKKTTNVEEPTDYPIRAFASADEFEGFLDQNHETAPGVYIKFAKKATGIPTVTGDEAVSIALCFGWIDVKAGKTNDARYWLVRYRPRLPKSLWSQKNVGTVSQLIEAGKMRPAGLAAVEAAKKDGRWERAYAGSATITVPDDFQDALQENDKANAFFATLNKTERYAVLWRLATVSPKGREKKIIDLITKLERKEIPGGSRKHTQDNAHPSNAVSSGSKKGRKEAANPHTAKKIGNNLAKARKRKIHGAATTVTLGLARTKLKKKETSLHGGPPPRRAGLRSQSFE